MTVIIGLAIGLIIAGLIILALREKAGFPMLSKILLVVGIILVIVGLIFLVSPVILWINAQLREMIGH